MLVTGAAGGLGGYISRELYRSGASLVLHDRSLAMLESLGEELDAEIVAGDLTDRDQMDRVVEQSGRVDVLIGNAGLTGTGALLGMDRDHIRAMVDVNVTANMELAYLLGPGMVQRGQGHMVFMGSLAGKAAAAGRAMYSGTKFALRGFAIGLRDELRGTGVGVSLIQPGFVGEVGMFASRNQELPKGVKLVAASDVAVAVRDAVERDRFMVAVAAPPVRALAEVANVAPGLVLWLADHTSLGQIRES